MEHQKAIAVLQNLLNSHQLNDEEKEAVTTAVGVLGWTALAKNRLKARKGRKEKDLEWQG